MQSFWKAIWNYVKEEVMKTSTSFDPEIPQLYISPKEVKDRRKKVPINTKIFIPFFVVAKDWEQDTLIDRRMAKQIV